jgi:sporulation protein YlmC with PRC-barrel domain
MSENSKLIIGEQVVRSKGDYVVGRVGNVIAIDLEKQRAQIDWNTASKSWVSFSALESTSIPYEIIPSYQKDRFTWTNPKYKRV